MPVATKTSARSKPSGHLRHTAGERREAVLQAAVAEFALHGLDGTSTEAIARRIGISQPYIFRLFPGKKALFLAAIDQCFDRVEAAFKSAVADPDPAADPGHHFADSPIGARLHTLGHAYVRLLARRELLLFQMQAYAACSDEDVRRKVRQRWEQLVRATSDVTGASRSDVMTFFARGMLLNVIAAIGLVPEKGIDRWGHEALGFA